MGYNFLMKLPRAEDAIIDLEKISGYLLNHEHRFGASKAAFFEGLGFRSDSWEKLAAALLRHARQNDIVAMKETPFGPRFEIQGNLTGPSGRERTIRTVWQFDKGDVAPRLITAYPVTR